MPKHVFYVESQEDLVRFTTLIKENSKIKFQVCPIASLFESDNKQSINSQQALSLAQERIKILKIYFDREIERASDQIIFCRPKLSDSNDNSSIATVSL
ncbi:MAG: hypothetical protein HON23_04250 [Rickettsiales bacterium]|jgi:hypothetical protein|nr:hypothetical protein [Rickettsiales bacterium]